MRRFGKIMEEKGQQGKDRVSPASISALPLHGDGLVPDNYMDKPLSPKDERIVSPNPSPDAESMRNNFSQSEALNASGAPTPVNQSNIFAPPEQTYFYGGYDDGSANWGDYSNYVHANNLQIIPPAIYNDNASLLFHPAYGFDYSQFSPIASPMSPIMIDGQLFSPHQVPMSPPPYYSQPVSPHVTSGGPTVDLAPPGNNGQEGVVGNGDNAFMAPGSGYYLHYGAGNNNINSYGFYKYPGDIGSGGESVPNRSMSSSDNTGSYVSPLTSGALYPAPVGILGSYEHIFGQIPQQQPAYGYGSVSGSSNRRYPQSGSFRGYNGNNYGNNSVFQGEASHLNRFMPEKGGKHRDRDGISMINEPHGSTPSDRNRGPRALKPKGDHQISSPEGKNDLYNRPDFVTTYENAKFFVIKSFSEDNVHKSIKYGVWASTPLGNRKLDAAYQEAKESESDCPLFLFFSVSFFKS